MNLVNKHLDPTPSQDRKAHTRCIDFLRNVCVTVLCVFDRVKMWTRNPALPSSEQTGLRKDRLDVEMHDPREPWTMQTAFHATSGVCVYRSKYTTGRTMTTLDLDVLKFLASKEPATLLPVKIAASQNQGGHQPNKRQTCPSGWLVAKMRPFRLVGWFNKVGLVGCLDGLPRIPLLM
jgi:hypothetical protein